MIATTRAHIIFLVILAIVGGWSLGVLTTTPELRENAPAGATYDLPPCPTEGSEQCYWDGSARGNGGGASFVRFDSTTYYPESN